MKTIAVIGAGPAGLTVAYEILKNSDEYKVVIFEKDVSVGGLSKSFSFEGGNIDIGGHRFFTRNSRVLEIWNEILPFDKDKMLQRNRKSHIFWENKFVEYPIKINIELFEKIGLYESINTILSYIKTHNKYKKVDTMEKFYINRFGEKLYKKFFENYTYKLWGIPAEEISAEWGAQRIQNLSAIKIIKNFICSLKNDCLKERTLIDKFFYPAFGSGQFWNEMKNEVSKSGGIFKMECTVKKLILKDGRITSILYIKNGIEYDEKFDYIVSSIPLKELIFSLKNVPMQIYNVAKRLKYRDMIIIAISVPEAYLGKNFNEVKDDNWIYVQEKDIPFGRIQILNNWSPYASKKDNILFELELFCNKGDLIWNLTDKEIYNISLQGLIKCDFVISNNSIFSYFIRKIEKAYPVYDDGYYDLDIIKHWINDISNLRCIGRNGQHCYNNMDHSMEMGIDAAKSILDKNYNRECLWNVNKKQEYIEK